MADRGEPQVLVSADTRKKPSFAGQGKVLNILILVIRVCLACPGMSYLGGFRAWILGFLTNR